MTDPTEIENAPLRPGVEVDIRPYLDKPMAVMAVVRRALQKAGYSQDAARFTEEALAGDPETLLDIARRYVKVP